MNAMRKVLSESASLKMQVHVCSQTLLIRSAELQSLPQKDLFYLKEKADPDRA